MCIEFILGMYHYTVIFIYMIVDLCIYSYLALFITNKKNNSSGSDSMYVRKCLNQYIKLLLYIYIY